MQYIFLLRHAITEPASANDFNRQLTEYGKKQALEIATYLFGYPDYLPSLILCSTAARTTQTAVPIIEKYGTEILYLPELYNPSAEDIKNLISEYNHSEKLMVISHNPAISRVASEWSEGRVGGLKPAQMAIFKAKRTSDDHIQKELILFYESI